MWGGGVRGGDGLTFFLVGWVGDARVVRLVVRVTKNGEKEEMGDEMQIEGDGKGAGEGEWMERMR